MMYLIIGDPIKNLKAETDSSLAMAREALNRTHEVFWATDEDLFLWNGRVNVRAEKFTGCREKSLPTTEMVKEPIAVNEFDAVFIRKDPPFNDRYLSLCWLLALEEKNVPMLNPPSKLVRYHEKLLPLEAVEAGYLRETDIIPTFLPTGKRLNVPKEFPRGEAVTKPWAGFGGKDVKRLPSPQTPEPWWFLQPLQSEIWQKGDRRVFILDGEVLGSFVRLPPEGEVKANIASGGRGVLREMTREEADLAERTAGFLKEIGIVFAGVDMLAGKISEVNITSPTGFETYHAIGGPRLVHRYMDFVEGLL